MKFVVYGPPVVKGRPRVVTRGKGGRPLPFPKTFTPKATTDFEKLVATAAIHAVSLLRDAFDELWDASPGDFELTVIIYRAKRIGDMDNYVKSVSDALNKIAYEDDRYIMAGHQRMHHDPLNPRVEVRVRRWDFGKYTMADWRA